MNDLIGRLIARRYRVETFLGKGGMAEVYKVWDMERSVHLAMKILHADLAEDKIFLRRFKREAQTLAKLQHPNIVRFYGLEQDADFVYILMDYVEGTTLRKEIFQAKKPVGVERILEIMRLVCAALNYAHKSGFVHCDVKPANIMLHKNGSILVADFGIARMTEAATVTMVGAGTPAYMSPEQAHGEAPVPQTDIYALGVILFEMLTGGERPFTGEDARITGSASEKMRWEQINLPAPSPRKFNPNISPKLEAVVLKCLEKQPENRYHDINGLLTAFSAAVGNDLIKQTYIAPQAAPQPIKKSEIIKKNIEMHAHPRNKRTSTIAWLAWLIGIVLIILALFPGGRYTIPFAISTSTPTATELQPTVIPTPILVFDIGSKQVSPKDGMTLLYVPAGKFTMGSKAEDALAECQKFRLDCLLNWFKSEEPMHEVILGAYWIDQTEITNKMYAKCVDANICKPLSNSSSYTRSSYHGNSEFDDYPVIYVDWNKAKTYCEWAGRKLPTEAEWEKAARSTDARIYPWGNSIDCSLANYWGKDNGNSACVGDTTKVGSYESGKSLYGAYDMAGNVWELVSSLYEPYPYNANDGREDLTASGSRVLRGGSWFDSNNNVRSASRGGGENYLLGFRCSRSQP